jgi:MazG family protein
VECPWDRKQTNESLRNLTIEETYELADAILEDDREEISKELGDLLLQVVFHATLAREVGAFDVEEVAEMIRRKLVNRHPHVFGEVVAEDASTVISNWEMIKGEEKSRDSLMDDIPVAMPAIIRADKMQRRAKSAGFDWDDVTPVFAKVLEEVDELSAVSADAVAGDTAGASAELGDLLFAVVNLARHLGVDPELSLAGAGDRFATRFRLMEEQAAAAGRDLGDFTLEELDSLWERAKSTESS